jgi:mRNA-degrading endonuclease RelE of RelBE toxin-antitoxin system
MKPKTRVAVAKDFQKQIYKLEREQERLYKKALRTLKMLDTNMAFDYFYNNQTGYNEFEEGLK